MEFLGYGTYNLHGIKEYFDPRTIFNKGIFKGSRIYDKNYMINYVNSIETHQIEFPSFNGKSNSYSLAKIAGLIANGGEIDGVRLFKNETINMFNKVLDPEYDEVLHYKIQKTYGGMTYFTSNNFHGFSGNITCIGGGGLGGSFMAWNRLKNFGFSYVMNGMGDPGLPLDTRALKLISSFYNIIENMK